MTQQQYAININAVKYMTVADQGKLVVHFVWDSEGERPLTTTPTATTFFSTCADGSIQSISAANEFDAGSLTVFWLKSTRENRP